MSQNPRRLRTAPQPKLIVRPNDKRSVRQPPPRRSVSNSPAPKNRRGPYGRIILALFIVLVATVAITATKGNSGNSQPHKGFNKHRYSITDPTSPWVIVNKLRPLTPIDYVPSGLTPVGNGQQMRAVAARALGKMTVSASKQGINFYPYSGYRSYQTQVAAYTSEVNAFGTTKADIESAKPGYSEHQTGWAVDLGTSGCQIGSCFASTPAGKWLATNSYKYGFILRYPSGYQNITGYEYEPWHFRYIGASLSTEMHKQGIKTLEQFFHVTGGTTYKGN